MKVYHGSYTAIDEIDLAKSHLRRDFGRGFYVTNLREQAEYWATKMGKRYNTTGVVTEFDFNEYVIRDMKLNVLRFDGYTGDWLDFIVKNRLNITEQQAHDYDIVEGNVANDDVAARVFDYQNGLVSKADFLNELKHKAQNHQICFCTVQSLQALIPVKNDMDIRLVHIDNNIVKALVSDFDKNEIDAENIYYKSNTYTQLADNTTQLYEKDWTEIYKMLLDELNSK
jgi:hypothetical protein